MHVGQRLSYSGELCTVRYIGKVEGTKGDWLGVEWDDPTRGKHNGEAGGKRYFQCISKASTPASFIRPSRQADKARNFIEAVRFKYASEHIRISFQIGQPAAAEKPIHFGTKEAEEVGFDKIAKKLADLETLKIVLLDSLCVCQPVAKELLEAWASPPTTSRLRFGSDISDICPKITELDLSRNLLASFYEVCTVCEQLEHLTSLRLDGNRLGSINISATEQAHFKLIFANVHNLSLESTLLSWLEIGFIIECFPALQTLSISSNELSSLNAPAQLGSLPPLSTIKLESNQFQSLADIGAIASLSSLRHVVLKYNNISSVNTSDTSVVFPHITSLDVSYNAIASWTFIDDLNSTFPALTSLRIAHNPIYVNLHSPAGRELTAEDGYMLTIARLPTLKTLNFSAVTAKDRLNAESYYLSLIVQELSLAPESESATIQQRHPRWQDLREEYGEPVIKRQRDHVDPRSLAARLLTLEVELSAATAELFGHALDAKVIIKNVPKRLNIYSVLGLVAKKFQQDSVATGLSLSLLTDDWEESEDGRVSRIIKLVPETRAIGTFIELSAGRLRLEFGGIENAYDDYRSPMNLSHFVKETAA